MNLRHFLPLLLAVLLIGCAPTTKDQTVKPFIPDEKVELAALGSYPDYYYNLANELMNEGRDAQAIEAYLNCIKHSKRQSFIEDALFNASLLYFKMEENEKAYAFMDSLISRKYTWLSWYKNADHPATSTATYTQKLKQIDSIISLKSDPNQVSFHYDDVRNFIAAFKKSESNWSQAPHYFYTDYFAKASEGLFFYQKFKIQSSSHQFAYRVEDKKDYFKAILSNLEQLSSTESSLKNYFIKFKALYPAAIFPDVYYLVGCFNAGGTSSPAGLLIGAEMHSKPENASLTNFNNWEKTVLRDQENLPLIIMHELVHIQQHSNYDTLLGNAIYEGAADFISQLICGSHINTHVHAWANEREAAVWEAFKKEMYGKNSWNWIGNANSAKDKPADLGYYVGYKICEAYYAKQSDKTQAIADILSITNWEEFYEKSGYMQ